ncbi:MAG: phosphoribosylaminoimidazolesuccinocarboxamide synthase [Erysipelotrichales bacterium]|nr:phosphoribosylaminoimidazolesuccinocarboxamide synthase [Erysipelotrichales bacterium]
MESIYIGKTKDVFKLKDGNYLLKFKDDVTSANGVFDPGANSTGLKIEGAGQAGLAMSAYFFKLLAANNIPTHFVDYNLSENTMVVKPVKVFGKGLEVICRLKATGSFTKRFGEYINDGAPLDYYVEVTTKNDLAGDPFINEEALTQLNILNNADYQKIINLTKDITRLIKAELAKKAIELYDIKYEFGFDQTGILLIDEISGGNMRTYKNNKKLMPLELSALVLK